AIAGAFLFTGASLQQVGLQYTTAGKAGFITGLYVVLVPLIGRLFGHRTDLFTWSGAILATAGLYFLSVTEQFTIAFGDLLELIGAVFWAGHVLLVGRYASRFEPVAFSVGQFSVCSVLSFVTALKLEVISTTGLMGAAIPIAYGGFISVGIGYTLQVVAQRDAPPAHAAILLSLESVFAALTGWLLLQELMSGRAIFGCVLMLAGMLLAQFGPSPEEKPVLIGTTGN
ncbi:MAG TPA: DMT family transporter, partial [Candidatus Ozemobacteraceae bacterium]|nr:DMT family transporter [Candidatus Ozemobacteraceae bacterium]